MYYFEPRAHNDDFVDFVQTDSLRQKKMIENNEFDD